MGYGRESFIKKFPGDLEEQRAGLHEDTHSVFSYPHRRDTDRERRLGARNQMKQDTMLGACWVQGGF